MSTCRLLSLKKDEGAKQMALDEAILTARAKNLVPNTLRFFTWEPKAITIGFFQSLKQEINIEKTKQKKIAIIRRYTGGGAIFHEQELTYSFVVSESRVPSDIIKSYQYICSGVIEGLNLLGLKAEFRPINDITVNNKKISGSAQTRKNGVVLQHGTVLIKVDVEKMFSLLRVSDEKLKGKMIENVKAGVTSLNKELKKDFEINKLEKIFIQGFAKALNLNLKKQDLTQEEKDIAKKLYLEKYSNKNWNNWR